MPRWEVVYGKRMDKALKNLRGNMPVMSKFVQLLDGIRDCGDPSVFGEKKHQKYRHCYGAHLTKSVSFIYRIDYATHTVYALDLGDHKWLYGRDNRP